MCMCVCVSSVECQENSWKKPATWRRSLILFMFIFKYAVIQLEIDSLVFFFFFSLFQIASTILQNNFANVNKSRWTNPIRKYLNEYVLDFGSINRSFILLYKFCYYKYQWIGYWLIVQKIIIKFTICCSSQIQPHKENNNIQHSIYCANSEKFHSHFHS